MQAVLEGHLECDHLECDHLTGWILDGSVVLGQSHVVQSRVPREAGRDGGPVLPLSRATSQERPGACTGCSALCLCSVVSDSVRPHGLQPSRLLCPWDSPGKILEWAAISFSRGSSRPRDQTSVSVSPALAGGFFTTAPPGKPLHPGFHVFRPHKPTSSLR